MAQEARKHRFSLFAAGVVVWMMFAAVVCYVVSVWLVVAVMEQANASAVFSGNVHWFAAALSAVVLCAIGWFRRQHAEGPQATNESNGRRMERAI